MLVLVILIKAVYELLTFCKLRAENMARGDWSLAVDQLKLGPVSMMGDWRIESGLRVYQVFCCNARRLNLLMA